MPVSVAMVTRFSNKLILTQGAYLANLNFIRPQIAVLRMHVSVALVTTFT